MKNKRFLFSLFALAIGLFFLLSDRIESNKFDRDLKTNQIDLKPAKKTWAATGKYSFLKSLRQIDEYAPSFEQSILCQQCDGKKQDLLIKLSSKDQFCIYYKQNGSYNVYAKGSYEKRGKDLLLFGSPLHPDEAYYRIQSLPFAGTIFNENSKVVSDWNIQKDLGWVHEVWKLEYQKLTWIDLRTKIAYGSFSSAATFNIRKESLYADTFIVQPNVINFGTIKVDSIKAIQSEEDLVYKYQKIWIKNYYPEPLLVYPNDWSYNQRSHPKYHSISPDDSFAIFLPIKIAGHPNPSVAVSKLFELKTSKGSRTIAYKGNFESMPHLLEVKDQEILLSKQDSDFEYERDFYMGEQGEGSFLLKNVSKKLLELSNFSSEEFIIISQGTHLLPPDSLLRLDFYFEAKSPSKFYPFSNFRNKETGWGWNEDQFFVTETIYFESTSEHHTEIVGIKVNANIWSSESKEKVFGTFK